MIDIYSIDLILMLDVATGGSTDWAYGTQNISLAYTFELRDQGIFKHISTA